MKAKDITVTVLLIIIPAAAVAWIRTQVQAGEAFLDNFLTFLILSIVVYIGSALITNRSRK